MQKWQQQIFSCLSIFLLLLSSTKANTTKPSGKGVTLQLLHRFSPSLSLHKTDSLEEFLERNEKQFINQRISVFQPKSTDAQLITPMPGPEHLFFVNLSIGEPPIEQYLAMDVGSSLIWVIGGSRKRQFRYSPEISLTHNYASCNNPACRNIRVTPTYCSPNGTCMYEKRYGDGQTSFGYLGYDHFVFHNATVKNVIMGTNLRGKGRLFREDNFYGIFALSPRFPSFVHRLNDLGGNKFSYFINGKITDNVHPYAVLTLGEIYMVETEGVTETPLEIDGNYYRVSLESISVGRTKLDINQEVFAHRENDGSTGTIIDTGTFPTWLADEAYNIVRTKVVGILVDENFETRIMLNDDYCFFGSVEEVKRIDFPVLSINFAGGASLKLDEDDLFIDKTGGYFCMTIKKSSVFGSASLTVIGLTAQQDYVMGFDLDKLELSIKLPRHFH